MNRTEDKIDLAQSQSAYRKGRNTTDNIWAHRRIIAIAQMQDITIYVTGIDMSSAFDTIQRGQLIDIAKEILNKDEIRILRVFLAETILEVKIENAKATPFKSNIGWPQGESINGTLVTIYFNRVLQQIREETGK